MNKEIWQAYKDTLELSSETVKKLVLDGYKWRSATDGLTGCYIKNEYIFKDNTYYLSRHDEEDGDEMPEFER